MLCHSNSKERVFKERNLQELQLSLIRSGQGIEFNWIFETVFSGNSINLEVSVN